MNELISDAQWQELLLQSREPFVVFKHSMACPISHWADRCLADAEETLGAPVYRVVVQTHRALSNRIAGDLDVRHETPQAIVVHRGRAVWHASHYAIDIPRLRAALAEAANESKTPTLEGSSPRDDHARSP